MKKWVAVLLVLLLMVGNTFAMAEEYTLRNGVQFGDTIVEVRAKETIEIAEDETSETRLWTQEGTVAGMTGVKLMYAFGDDGGLEEVKWQLPGRAMADSSDSDYEKLYNAMVSKYGAPLGYSNGDCYIITTCALDGAVLLSYLYTMTDKGVGDIRDYDEWVYEYAAGEYVKIEMAQFYYGASYSSKEYNIYVGYKYFSEDELTAARKEKQEENQAVVNDI